MAKSALLELMRTLEGVKSGPYFVGPMSGQNKRNLMAKSAIGLKRRP